ncbi:hypothetical protein FIBSPDRAFT_1038067 [Athelia psychrophila]|uniref:Uncharacterized protein n=1 Tax=Athelia psychrophila TaxID=1759441 RepID=A0A166TP18_9AGAM|nr:hypothetical protein FIBSPDRAFT_1038067 [Fibularhizoctonia sp. CBS 109695]
MNSRSETLGALSKYIETQRSLLARTNEDIERLQHLRTRAMEEPQRFVGQDGSIALPPETVSLQECAPSMPTNIDWSLFASLDPAPIRAFTHRIQRAHALAYPKQPNNFQKGPLSSLQHLVKDARESILQPLGLGSDVDAGFKAPFVLPDSLDDSPTRATTGSATGNVRAGKKRGGLRIVIPSLSQLRERGHNEVDTSGSTTPISTSRNSPGIIRNAGPYCDVGEPASAISSPTTATFSNPSPTTPSFPPSPPIISDMQPKTKGTGRSRKSATIVSASVSTTARTRARRAAAAPMDVDAEPAAKNAPTITIKLGKRGRAASTSPPPPQPTQPPGMDVAVGTKGKTKEKKKPETYKQAWSVSEQHLLEKLLDEMPEGTKNRWQKISLAMNGKRTPRQVASRVQKYFEKLKRYGVADGDAGG